MYQLVITFSSIEELKRRLRELLEQLEGRSTIQTVPACVQQKIKVLCDESVRKLGSLLTRLAADRGIQLEVYEVDSSIDREVEIDGVTHVPVKDDLDVLRVASRLKAILVTGDKKLAETAKAYGTQVIYIPPSGVISKEDYALKTIEKLTELIQTKPTPSQGQENR